MKHTIDEYKQAIDSVPETVAWLCETLLPTNSLTKELPSSGGAGPGSKPAMNLHKYAAVNEILKKLHFWEGSWRSEFTSLSRDFTSHWSGPSLTGRSEEVAAIAGRFAAPILEWWDDIIIHPSWIKFAMSLDEWLWPSHARATQARQRQIPRVCSKCGSKSVLADASTLVVMCGDEECGFVVMVENWVSPEDAAEKVDVTDRTIRRWVEAGDVRAQGTGPGRKVLLGDVLKRAKMSDLRARLFGTSLPMST